MLKYFSVALITVGVIGCGGGGGSSESTPSQPAPNNPPVAIGDNFEVGMNVSTSLTVLANDSDSDAFSVTDVTETANGSLINNGSEVVYTPNTGFTGEDSFSYTVTDSIGQTASAEVNLTIVNLPPALQNDQITPNQSESTSFDPLVNDVSPGGHSLEIISLSVPENGAVTQDGSTITYIPNTGYAGDDSFIYVVEDGFGDQATATVSITIENLLPVLTDDEQTISQNQSITIDALSNDSDAAGDELTITVLSGVINGEAKIENNKVVYTPNQGFAGNEIITYTVVDKYDGQQNAEIAVTIENVEPIATNDTAYAEIDEAMLIDVLGNDTDVEGDTLTIQSVSTPQNGTVEIVDDQIRYTPNTGFEGDDTFGYTMTDSNGASDSAFVSVSVSSPLVVQGKLVGYEKAGTVVNISHGDLAYSTTTDSQGNYSIELAIDNQDELVIAYADNAATNYHLRAYLGTLSNLLNKDSNEDNVVEDVYLSDLTTAEYELIFKLLDGAEAGSPAELLNMQYQADNFFQMQMAITSDIINSNNGIALPVGFDSVNDYIRNTSKMSQQLAKWREENDDIYYGSFTKLMNEEDLATYPSELASGKHAIAESFAFTASPKSVGDMHSLEINGATGSYDGKYTANVSKVNNRLSLEFSGDNPKDRYMRTYCSDGNYDQITYNYLNYNRLEFVKIYSTTLYDVYLQKITAEKDSSSKCKFDATNFYRTTRLYHKQPFQVSAGDYYLEVSKIMDEGRYTGDYRSDTAELSLNSDGSFSDTYDSDNILTGTWVNRDNELTLSYVDGRSLTYSKVIDRNNSPILIAVMHENGKLVTATDSYLFQPSAFTWPHNTGFISYSFSPSIDPVMIQEHRFNLHDDSTATSEWINEKGEVDVSLLQYTWQLENNKYTLTSYYENGGITSYCDISQDNCTIDIQREIEIIGESNGIYYVKGTFKNHLSDGTLLWKSNSVNQISFTPK